MLLRRFEQAFEAKHGRRVKYHKDIAPVEYEYRRYKELKSFVLLADKSEREDDKETISGSFGTSDTNVNGL